MVDSSIDKMAQAKTWLINKMPFFARIAVGIEYINADEAGLGDRCKTMMTDGFRIWWSPAFVEHLSIQQVGSVIMHEVLHICWLHHLRRGHRHPKFWNFAADFAINPVVKDAGGDLPGIPHGLKSQSKENGYLYDDTLRDKSANEIYEILIKDANLIKLNFKMDGGEKGNGEKDDSDGSGGDDGTPTLWGGVIEATNEDGSPLSDADKKIIEEEVKIMVKQAAEVAKARGNLPAGLEGLIEAVGAPKVNWKDYIQTWVAGHTPDDYTYARPNRRMMANFRVYMPRMRLSGAGTGVLSIDTSGSVSDQELRDYVREIAGVIEMCNPDKLIIIQHDAVVTSVTEWEAGDDFKNLKIKGRGGTCITPVFNKIKTLDDQIDWMICFTDMGIGDYPTPAQAPDFPVLWCATGPDNAPFGTYLPLKEAMDG